MSDPFTDAAGYEQATGRFSRQVARQFVPWLGIRRDARWLDCGCGTGALTSAIIDLAWAGEVTGLDSSNAFLEHARRSVPGAQFERGSITEIPFPDGRFDAVVAGCVLHHLDDPVSGATEMARVAAPGGTVAAYEWERPFALNRLYWESAARAGFGGGGTGGGFESVEELSQILAAAGVAALQTTRLEATVEYSSVEDWWETVLGRHGDVYEHFSGLAADAQEAVRARAREQSGSGAVRVTAGAWAAKGRR